MISFDLLCDNGHTFEGWFSTTKDFDKQKKYNSIECPFCSSKKIQKALMAPNVSTTSNEKLPSSKSEEHASQYEKPRSKSHNSPEVLSALKELKKVVEDNCDYVGDKFAEEARKISYGETKPRSIYGETSSDEAKELHEEGIDFGILPWANREDA